MARLRPTSIPPVGLGITSLVLGTIGWMLFFMPILGIPLSAAGLVFGIIGLVAAFSGGWVIFRWSLAGVAVSALALAVNVAIARAPEGYFPSGRVPLDTQPVPERPYIPPPARPSSKSNLILPAGMHIASSSHSDGHWRSVRCAAPSART